MRAAPTILLTAMALAVVACAPTTEYGVSRYQGEYTRSRVADLVITMEDGSTKPLPSVLEGYEPDPSFIADSLPIMDLFLIDVVIGDLLVRLATYDANENGRMEDEEVVVFYIMEAAKGLGQPVRHLGGDEPIGAVFTPPADTSGLVAFSKRNRAKMTPKAQNYFEALEFTGREEMLRSKMGGEVIRP